MLLFLTKFDTLYFIRDLDAACTHGNQFIRHLIHTDERRYHFPRDIVFQVYDPSHIARFKKINSLVTSDGVTIPKSISGIELSRQQQQDLVNDKTIFVAGLKDKRGVEYDAYIQVNHDKKKLGFYSDNPSFDRSAVKEITPASKNRTQVAVNSEGKTNEATKKVKEPLKKGQDKPTEKQKTKQDKKEKQEQTDKPKQSRGRKR